MVDEPAAGTDPAQSTYTAAIAATKLDLQGQVNPAAIVHELYTMQQGDMLFSEYLSKVIKISQKVKLDEMTWEKAAMYTMVINTSSDRLRSKALAEQMDFTQFIEFGLSYFIIKNLDRNSFGNGRFASSKAASTTPSPSVYLSCLYK